MAGTRLLVFCVHCHRTVAQVPDVGLSTLAVMATHLRRRHPEEQLAERPSRDAILAHFRVTLADPDEEPPNVA
jgi:hypothetical protein